MVGTRVYVGGLAYGTRERDIEKFFRGYGRIREVLLKNGYGFVVSAFCILLISCLREGKCQNLYLFSAAF